MNDIIKRIRNLIWPKKTLGSILGGFQKTIDQLDEVIVESNESFDSNWATIERLEKENVRLMEESHQASVVLKNIRSLINN